MSYSLIAPSQGPLTCYSLYETPGMLALLWDADGGSQVIEEIIVFLLEKSKDNAKGRGLPLSE